MWSRTSLKEKNNNLFLFFFCFDMHIALFGREATGFVKWSTGIFHLYIPTDFVLVADSLMCPWLSDSVTVESTWSEVSVTLASPLMLQLHWLKGDKWDALSTHRSCISQCGHYSPSCRPDLMVNKKVTAEVWSWSRKSSSSGKPTREDTEWKQTGLLFLLNHSLPEC